VYRLRDPVPVDLAYLVRNNIYVFGIRGVGKSATHRAAGLMAQKRFDAKLIHTHSFPLSFLPWSSREASASSAASRSSDLLPAETGPRSLPA
jgi:hypothetical protein